MSIDPNHDIVPTLRMFDGLMMNKAADEILTLRKRMAELEEELAAAKAALTKIKTWAKLAESLRLDVALDLEGDYLVLAANAQMIAAADLIEKQAKELSAMKDALTKIKTWVSCGVDIPANDRATGYENARRCVKILADGGK